MEGARVLLYPYLFSWKGRLAIDAMLLVIALFFYGAVFQILSSMKEQLERQNRELLALHEAGLDVAAELSLDTVLQKVVDQAANLLEARYGALAVVGEGGRMEAFVTTGISAEERERIGRPPRAHGLLGITLQQGERLRVADLTKDPRAAGFPPHHPEMRSLLAAPVACKGPFNGNLYLCEKRGGGEFTPEEEETLVRFAVHAAIAIDNAHLHGMVRDLGAAEERLRIAHEMHDGLAQILAYVNTKAQVVQEYLRSGRSADADAQLAQLSSAAREVYADVREGIFGLRMASSPVGSFAGAVEEYAQRWRTHSGVETKLELSGEVRLPPASELQLLRIVQEALSNVRKHSRAHLARIALSQANGLIALVIEDDGVGFNPEAPGRKEFPRFGLATMRERAESIGGRVEFDSAPGKGTRVRVELPATTS